MFGLGLGLGLGWILWCGFGAPWLGSFPGGFVRLSRYVL